MFVTGLHEQDKNGTDRATWAGQEWYWQGYVSRTRMVPTGLHEQDWQGYMSRTRMVLTGLHEQDKEWYWQGYMSRTRNGTDRATWAGQGMVQSGHTRTCFSLAQGCRSGRRLCVKTGFGDTPHTNICYFHDFNKYLLRENMGQYFVDNLVIILIIIVFCNTFSITIKYT
jgi:hypothetical protein